MGAPADLHFESPQLGVPLAPVTTSAGSAPSVLHVLGSTIFTTLAVIYTIGYFTACRVHQVALSIPITLARKTALHGVLRRYPYAVSVLSVLLMATVFAPWGAAWFPPNGAGVALRIALFLCMLGVYEAAGSWFFVDVSRADIERAAKKWPERWFATRLNNPLDTWMVRIALEVTFLIAPPLLLLLVEHSVYAAIFYYFSVHNFGARLETLDHSEMHSDLFRFKHLRGRDRLVMAAFRLYVRYFVSPICLRIPNWYRVQHVTVHHAENNGPDDDQSTLYNDRASFIDFAKNSFKVGINMTFSNQLVPYLIRKKRTKQLRIVLLGLAIYYGTLGLIALWSWPVALFLVVVRFSRGPSITLLFYRWHGLVDVSDHENVFKNTLNFRDTNPDLAYGGGMHLEHHLHQSRHWSRLRPDRASDDEYAQNRALSAVMPRGFLSTYFTNLWQRRFDLLAPHLELEGGCSEAELVKIIEERTLPFGGKTRSPAAEKLDVLLGTAVGTFLLD